MADTQKFKSLVHYVCAQSPDPAKLGATKLNKILWFAEKEAYLRLGSPISGGKYVKRQFGPVPANILPVLSELEDEGKILIRNVQYFGRDKREFISRVEPSLDGFSANEISIINRAINVICNRHTAVSISDKSHDEVWELAQIGEEIPFYAAFGSRGEVTEEHMSWAQEQASQIIGESA